MYTTPGREFLFREIVKGLEEKYDHILIDCPPSLGIITQNALMASDYVIIPTDGNYFAMKGIEKIHYIIGLLKRKLGADVRILGYFMTKYNAGRKLDVDIRESLVRSLGDGVFETVIRSNVAPERHNTRHRAYLTMRLRQTGLMTTGSWSRSSPGRIKKINK
ncbi:AAA family ATPase [Bacteroides fragilis]|nr:AAA family ATPase [Bacteroides fragilis]